MYIVNDIFHNGSVWALVIALIYIFNALKPLIKSHLRNNHELSLFRCACRAVASVAQVAEASPSDRENEAISLIFRFANSHNIPIDMNLAKALFNQAKVHFKANGGQVKKPLQVSVQSDGSVKEDDNK